VMVLITRESLRSELKEAADGTVAEVKYALQSVLARELEGLKHQLEESLWTAVGTHGQRPTGQAVVPSPLLTPVGSGGGQIVAQRSSGAEQAEFPVQLSPLSAAGRAGKSVRGSQAVASKAAIRQSVAPLLRMESHEAGGETESQGISWFNRHRKGFNKNSTSQRSKSRISHNLDGEGNLRGSVPHGPGYGRYERDASYVSLSSDPPPGEASREDEEDEWQVRLSDHQQPGRRLSHRARVASEREDSRERGPRNNYQNGDPRRERSKKMMNTNMTIGKSLTQTKGDCVGTSCSKAWVDTG